MKKSKLLIVGFGTMAMCAASLAKSIEQDLRCGALTNASHQALANDRSYTVVLSNKSGGTGIYLQSRFIGPTAQTTISQMTETGTDGDVVQYSSGGITANVLATRIGKHTVTTVEISEKIGDEVYSAECNK